MNMSDIPVMGYNGPLQKKDKPRHKFFCFKCKQERVYIGGMVRSGEIVCLRCAKDIKKRGGIVRCYVPTIVPDDYTVRHTGVYWIRGKWQAEYSLNGKLIYLGRYKHRWDAITARQKAEEKYDHLRKTKTKIKKSVANKLISMKW